VTSDTDSPPQSTSYLPIPDQWLLVGLLVIGAVLAETSLPELIRLPLTLGQFIRTTPDTWAPLLVVAILMAAALVLEGPRWPRQERRAWFVAGAASVAGVVWFFRAGDINWHATPDWAKEWTYHTALRESLSHGRLPWFLNVEFQGTDRFFANPETNVFPHTVLLAWLDVTRFVILQCASLLIVGLMASYRLARDLKLGPTASMAFLAIFLMNGHLIAHLHTGHLQWAGYFVFPCLLLFLHRAATGDMGGRTQSGLALGMALIALVGGWHLFVWGVIFVGVLVVIDRARWRFGASVMLLVAGLSALRIVPAMVQYRSPDTMFVGSYQQLSILVRALVGELRTKIDYLDWWEYDVFVGWVGLVIITAGLTAPLSRTWRHSVAALWPPSLAMLVLSTFDVYRWTFHRLPGFESERVASRLLILGILGFALIGCVQLNMWLARMPRSRVRLAAVAVAGLLLLAQLVVHTNGRRPTSATGLGPPSSSVVSDSGPDLAYAASVGGGAALSLISLGIAIHRRRIQGPRRE
jgi:hypothetical protein